MIGRLQAGLFACVLFGFPLVSTLPVFLGVESRPISMLYRAVVAGASLCLLGLALVQRRPAARAQHVLLALALMAVLLGRLVWDASIAPLPLDIAWGDIWPYALGVTFLPALVFLVQMDDGALAAAHRWTFRLGVLAALAVLAAAAVALANLENFLRLDTGVLNPISIGHAGVSLFILSVVRPTAAAQVRHGGGPRATRVLAALLAVGLLVGSGSKGPILAWFVVLSAMFLVRARISVASGRALRGVLLPIALVLLVAWVTATMHAMAPLPIIDRFVGIAYDQSTSERLRLLSMALAQFEESPLVGSSVYEYESRLYPHNVIVESLMVGGFLALAPLLLLILENVRTALASLLHGSRDRWLSLLYLQYLVEVMFSGSLFYSTHFWALSLAMLAMAARRGLDESGVPGGVDQPDGPHMAPARGPAIVSRVVAADGARD